MGIRNAAKAIILQGDKVLLNRCYAKDIGEYYTLPGGGQNPYESMHEALQRECMEETGLTVVPGAFIGLLEEIYTDEASRAKHPQYTHKILHIFACTLAGTPAQAPSEKDPSQLGIVWVKLGDAAALNIQPPPVREHFMALANATVPLNLGIYYNTRKKSI